MEACDCTREVTFHVDTGFTGALGEARITGINQPGRSRFVRANLAWREGEWFMEACSPKPGQPVQNPALLDSRARSNSGVEPLLPIPFTQNSKHRTISAACGKFS